MNQLHINFVMLIGHGFCYGIMSYTLYTSKFTHGVMGDYRLFELNCVRNFM